MQSIYSYRHIWKITYPIFLSLLAQNVINVTDTAFLGRVGSVELGASAMGGLYYIFIFTIAFGFSVGSQIMIGRRNGERNYQAAGAVVMQGFVFLLLLAALCFGLSRLLLPDLMTMMVSSDVIRQATMEFLDWRIYGFFFSFINVMFRAFYVGITRTKALTLNAVVMAITNIILDWLLIFGHAGFPKMGIQGAAIASVASEAVSVLFFLVYTQLTVDRRKYGLDRLQKFDFGLLRQVLSISIFTMLQYFISMGTFYLFFLVIERQGEQPLAIANIILSIYIVVTIPVNALATTANTIVSNLMGAGHTANVVPALRRLTGLSFATMGVCTAAMMLFPDAILATYTDDGQLIAGAVPSIYVISAAALISAAGSIVFNGVSGTGNTRSALWIEMVVLLLYTSCIVLLGIVLHQPVHICFLAEMVYFAGLLIGSVLYFRFAAWQQKQI